MVLRGSMEDRKIESCIRASFEMLSEGAERNLLLCLAIFPGDFNGTSGTCRLHWFVCLVRSSSVAHVYVRVIAYAQTSRWPPYLASMSMWHKR